METYIYKLDIEKEEQDMKIQIVKKELNKSYQRQRKEM